MYFAIRVLSAAISTSVMRPLAASMLVFWRARSCDAKRNLDIEAALSARRVATFWIACVNTATEMSVRSMVLLASSAAKVMSLPAANAPLSALE